MNKQIIVFLSVAQLIILIGHIALYFAALFFFPYLQNHQLSAFITMLALAFSFLGFSIIDFKNENELVRLGYILSGVWMVWFGYSLFAAALASITYLVIPGEKTTVAYVLFALAAAIALYGTINARVIRTKTISVTLPNLPNYWKGKTGVLVSDLHLGHVLRRGFVRKIVKKINALKPDIVLVPGDFFDGVKTSFKELALEFKQINAPEGIFFVSGNHEQYAGYEACEQAISKAGIRILENQKTEINGLQILGLAYFSESQETESLVEKLLNEMKIDPAKPSILLKHVPNRPQAAAKAGVSLQLSGHTHHGQVWPGGLIAKKVYKGFDYGLKKIGNFQIYTSSGVGTWGPPVKAFTKSEIVKIIFD